jgi:hypothetical protein
MPGTSAYGLRRQSQFVLYYRRMSCMRDRTFGCKHGSANEKDADVSAYDCPVKIHLVPDGETALAQYKIALMLSVRVGWPA